MNKLILYQHILYSILHNIILFYVNLSLKQHEINKVKYYTLTGAVTL